MTKKISNRRHHIKKYLSSNKFKYKALYKKKNKSFLTMLNWLDSQISLAIIGTRLRINHDKGVK